MPRLRVHGWTWLIGSFPGFALVTAVSAVALMDVNADTYQSWVNFDPQGDDQEWEALRISAALIYTSGHSVGHLCAALFGVLVGAAMPATRRRQSVVVSVAGGAGLAASSLAVVLSRAPTEIDRLWMVDELTRHGFAFDPDLLHNLGVFAMLAAGLVAFPLWAVVGLGTTLARGPGFAGTLLLVWHPVSVVGGLVTAGVPAVMVPLFSNAGSALLLSRWPAAAIVVTLALALWAAGLYLVGSATRMQAARAGSA